MKYLQIFNATLAALGATFTIVLGVVCLQLWINRDQSASLREQLPFVFEITLGFVALGALAGLVWAAHWRAWPGRWVLQALPLAAMGGIVALLLSLRAG